VRYKLKSRKQLTVKKRTTQTESVFCELRSEAKETQSKFNIRT